VDRRAAIFILIQRVEAERKKFLKKQIRPNLREEKAGSKSSGLLKSSLFQVLLRGTGGYSQYLFY
jgi:hypothetical protein